jgi:mannosyl-oligosaccharide alpha-1,2-mannosidase
MTRQEAVKMAFKHAWSAYKKYAWGYDELKPVGKTHHTWFGIGLTILDSLDTMHVMGLHDGNYPFESTCCMFYDICF